MMRRQTRSNRSMSVNSVIRDRANMARRLGQQFNGRRDIYNVLGYAKELGYDDYFYKFDRQDIAGRIVDAPPVATWRYVPVIREDDDDEKDTPFEDAWKALNKRLRINFHMERVDRLAGIGRYGVLLIGVRGSVNLDEPLEKGVLNNPDDIIYLSPYSEKSAAINSWDRDPSSPRFGLPHEYRIDISGDFKEQIKGVSKTEQWVAVHHSRVIHVAEGLLEDEVFGRPRLKRVMNLLNDLEKIVGGSAEMFWQGAQRILHANLNPDIDIGEEEAAKITEEIDEFIHGLRQYIRTQGMDLKTLAGQVSDPSGIFDMIISLLSGATTIPKRILIGAEAGQLASSQDETNFNTYIQSRQLNFAEPQMLRPFIDRLIWLGALPEPAEEYSIEWPNLFALDEKEKAELADKRAAALQKVAPFGDTTMLLSYEQIVKDVLGLDIEIADEVQKRLNEMDVDGGSDEVDEGFRQQVRGNRA